MKRTGIAIGSVFLGFLALGTAPPPAGAITAEELREALANARPAPVPAGVASSAPSAPGRIVTHNLVENTTTEMPASAMSFEQAERRLPYVGTPLPVQAVDRNDGIDRGGPGGLACTPPALLLATHGYPQRTVWKLLMRFNVSGTNYYYVCSAASVGSFHLLTAGHCIYNRDPNGDGSTADRKFADEVWAWPAQTDLVDPFANPDWPWGVAKAFLMRSYSSWNDSGDLNWDMGYITLDRRLGDRVGWMGSEANVTTASLNFNGYPAEPPYVPASSIGQYPGFDANNVTSYTTDRINLCAYTYGGHSGGPAYRYDGTNRYIQGVNSTSNRVGSASETRISSTRFNDLFSTIIPGDETTYPPVARPELIEYVLDLNAKDLLQNSVSQGQTFQLEYNVLNVGFANSGTITANFYLSTAPWLGGTSYFLGSTTFSLDAYFYTNPTVTLTVPFSVPPGTYYAGWNFSGTVAEYNTDNNVAYVADEQLTVTMATCSADAYEPDDASGQASFLFPGSSQTHNLCPTGDDDWYYFVLNSTSDIVLETSGPTGDTRMWLYDSALNEIEFDDDDGANLFSRIDRACGVDPLPPGTYYVHIDEFGTGPQPGAIAATASSGEPKNRAMEIGSYSILLTRADCCSPDAYEPDDVSGQATALFDGVPQTHGLCPTGDDDWFTFTLNRLSEVRLETTGSVGDTRMWLYDSGLNEVEYDDDGGSGFFSLIDRVCLTDHLPAGTYYVRIDEYGTAPDGASNARKPGNEALAMDAYTLTLTLAYCCPGDGYEPDDALAQAKPLASGAPQNHSICPLNDDDWYTFTLVNPSHVVLETTGPSGDTRMWLYKNSLASLVAYDDDGGAAFFSRLEMNCAPGTYYVYIDEYDSDEPGASSVKPGARQDSHTGIPEYALSLTATLNTTGTETTMPTGLALSPGRPNPFRESAEFEVSIPRQLDDAVDVRIYGLHGQVVKTLATGVRSPGIHRYRWDGRDDAGRRVAAGLYFCRMRGGSFDQARTVILSP